MRMAQREIRLHRRSPRLGLQAQPFDGFAKANPSPRRELRSRLPRYDSHAQSALALCFSPRVQAAAQPGAKNFGGERGIRTLVTSCPVNRISNPAHSTTLPPLRGAGCMMLLASCVGVFSSWPRVYQPVDAAHVGLERLGNQNITRFSLAILQYRHQRSPHCKP